MAKESSVSKFAYVLPFKIFCAVFNISAKMFEMLLSRFAGGINSFGFYLNETTFIS